MATTPNPIPGPIPGLDEGMNAGIGDAMASQPVIPPSNPQPVGPAPDIGGGQPGNPPPLPPRPPGTGVAAQPPPSKAEFFRNMLGQFFYAVGTGLANRGTGPDADARGAGAALTALPNRDIMQQQLEIQRQQAQGLAAYHGAQANALQAGSQTVQVPVFGSDGKVQTNPDGSIQTQPILQKDVGNYFGKTGTAGIKAGAAAATTGANIASREKIAGEQIGSKEKIAGEQIGSKEKLAGANLTEKIAEFKSTDQYRKWKTQLDDDTKIRVADLTASKAPAAMLQTASFADGALTMMSDASAAMKRLEAKGVLGSNVAQNKVENWIFGKGLVDPSLDPETRQDIGKLRAAMGYTSTAAMRAHTGRTSREIYDDFKQRLGAGQDWSALRGAMDETQTLMTHYRDAATNANIKNLRTGGGGGPKTDPVQSLIDKYKPK